jgi:hypothetical protein
MVAAMDSYVLCLWLDPGEENTWMAHVTRLSATTSYRLH